MLILGFAMLNFSIGQSCKFRLERWSMWFTYIYLSGVTFSPSASATSSAQPRWTVGGVAESGLGFAFLAVVIGYMPVLYQAFSKRESAFSLLRCPRRLARLPPPRFNALRSRLLHAPPRRLPRRMGTLERGTPRVHHLLSGARLAIVRSTITSRGWGAITAVLDTCAVSMSSENGSDKYQERVTFAAAGTPSSTSASS